MYELANLYQWIRYIFFYIGEIIKTVNFDKAQTVGEIKVNSSTDCLPFRNPPWCSDRGPG